jgi:hypothetical protein
MASERLEGWKRDHVLWSEVFATLNLAFLTLDIYLAHLGNNFARRAEFAPLIFSMLASFLLAAALWWREFRRARRLWHWIGLLVGWCSIGVGVAGVIYHLDSQFFYERTLRSLTYAAPFAAPLAYTGIGLILLLDRMVPAESSEWPLWIVFLTLAGFFGNFVLSLSDHAGNGFFRWTEWIPVVSSAFAVTFLLMPLFAPPTRRYLTICAAVLLLQAVVGAVGFLFHVQADIHGVSRSIFQNLVDGAPPFAPLLFPNLALLGCIGLWALARSTTKAQPGSTER